MKKEEIKLMTPPEVQQWIIDHDANIMSFCRMMNMHRKSLQRILRKSKFKPWMGYIFTMFCHGYDLGYIIEGMGSMERINKKKSNGPAHVKRKKRTVARDGVAPSTSSL